MKTEQIEFKDIQIIKTEFELNNNYDESLYKETEERVEIGFDPQLLVNKDNVFEGIVLVSTKVYSKNFREENKPFYLEIQVLGKFDSEQTGKPITDFSSNCFNIVIPYIRSYITTFTSLAGINPVIFPPVNIYELMEEMENNKDN